MYSHFTNGMNKKANISNKYLLSTFRSFCVYGQFDQNTQACLSVTRTGNSLTLQPDDFCISQKYIGADGIDESNKNKTDDTDGKDNGNKDKNRCSTTRQSTDKDGKPEEESKSSDNNSYPNNTTAIVIGMIALVVVVSLLIAVVICLRRRKATNGARKPIVSESSTATNVIKGTCAIINTTGHRASSGNNIMEEHEYDTPGDGTDAHTVSSTKPNNSKIRSDKPDRDTSRQNQKLQKNYENFKHVSTENRKVDSDVDFEGEVVAKTDKHEYVALNQNMAPQSTEHEYAEMHVYNNTPVQNDDNEGYD